MGGLVFQPERKDAIEQETKDGGLIFANVFYSWPWAEFYDARGVPIRLHQEELPAQTVEVDGVEEIVVVEIPRDRMPVAVPLETMVKL